MTQRPVPATPPGAPGSSSLDRRVAIAGGIVLGGLGLIAIALLGLVFLARGDGGAAAAPTVEPGSFAYAEVRDAPPLELTDQDGNPFSLESLRGQPVLVFFGYTHCPDVCPATIGTLNEVFAKVGDGPRALFVSIDPDRDTVDDMKNYLRYLPKNYTALVGTPDEVLANTGPWGVKYAKVDEGSPDGYAMSHTADVFLVDAQGKLRARFPFGTESEPIAANVKALLEETPVTAGPAASASSSAPSSPAPSGPPVSPPASLAPGTVGASAAPSPGPGEDLRVLLVSSSVWAGPETPVIVTLSEPSGAPLDPSVAVQARVIGANETATAADVPVTSILPVGADRASYIADVQIPLPGWWRLDLVTSDGRKGSVPIQALDPGSTAAIGAPAPDIDTPTLDDVGGKALALTTQEAPDLRFYQRSTADARRDGKPYVLVLDSSRFRVSPACGRAVTMVRYLLDRWGDEVDFVHMEPFEYQVVTEAPVLSGDIADPPLKDQAKALGLGDATWPATDMPWIFIVDGEGIVRAKYRDVVGTADVDLVLSQITGRNVQGS
ncbi:MAG TPA: SCO family protein [Candidatus Limnocylindrales bacterium]|nr:SCO family protein [Candidatus Limnocylindrales bacterium]